MGCLEGIFTSRQPHLFFLPIFANVPLQRMRPVLCKYSPSLASIPRSPRRSARQNGCVRLRHAIFSGEQLLGSPSSVRLLKVCSCRWTNACLTLCAPVDPCYRQCARGASAQPSTSIHIHLQRAEVRSTARITVPIREPGRRRVARSNASTTIHYAQANEQGCTCKEKEKHALHALGA